LAGLGDLAARKHSDAVCIQQQADHHGWVKRRRAPGFVLIWRIEPAYIQLGHRIQQEEDQVAFRQLSLRAMSLLSVALGLPGPIVFPVGLAHHGSPGCCVTQGWHTGSKHYHLSSAPRQLSTDKLALFRTASY